MSLNIKLWGILIMLAAGLSGCAKINQPLTAEKAATASPTEQASVPLPSGEYIVGLFFKLLGDKRIPEAIAMLNEAMVPDEVSKQAGGVQFNGMELVKVIKVEPWQKEAWTEDLQTFKATLSVDMAPNTAEAPIPYYGWEGEPDIRWVTLNKNSEGRWQIAEIATGP